jgi:hypothetical protein
MQVSQCYKGMERDFLRRFCNRAVVRATFSLPWVLRATPVAVLTLAIGAFAQTGQGAIGGAVHDESGAFV